MGDAAKDPYLVAMRSKTIPMALLPEVRFAKAKTDLLGAEPFTQVFGSKATRKKPRSAAQYSDIAALLSHVDTSTAAYQEAKDGDTSAALAAKAVHRNDYKGFNAKLFEKGQSRRIWAELYKVIDASDVVVQVLDIRDPMGTRSRRIGTVSPSAQHTAHSAQHSAHSAQHSASTRPAGVAFGVTNRLAPVNLVGENSIPLTPPPPLSLPYRPLRQRRL
jgi:hypothetical protein